MLRLEKLQQQAVHLQQRLAREHDAVALHGEAAPVFEQRERGGELLQRVGAELRMELAAAVRAELEHQHELADVALVGLRRIRAEDGQFAGLHLLRYGAKSDWFW